MDPQITSAIIQGFSTLCAAGAAAWGISYQIRKQAEQARGAILESEARKLKMRMYEEGIEAARKVADAEIELTSKLRVIGSALSSRKYSKEQGFDLPPFITKPEEIAHLKSELNELIIKFVYLVENRRIIDPRILIFRDMLHAFKYEIDQEYHSRLSMPLYVVGFPATTPDALGLMNDIERDLALALDATIEKLEFITPLMEDFSVEMQNTLLGDALKNKVQHRLPLDPSSVVVTLDSYDDLQKRIKQMPWGVKMQQIESEARTRYLQVKHESIPTA